MLSIKKVIQRNKKSAEKTTVDFNVQSQRMNVKMNQPLEETLD
jgi:hypothetical protein